MRGDLFIKKIKDYYRPPSVSLRRTQTITARPANTQTP